MDKLRSLDRAVRRELDRMAGELLRRQDETDASLRLYERRERLRAAAEDSAPFALWRRLRSRGTK